MIWTLAFWKGAGERALATAWQTFIAALGVTALGAGTTLTDLAHLHWESALSITAGAVILSLVKSLNSVDFTAGVVAPTVTTATADAVAATTVPAAAAATPLLADTADTATATESAEDSTTTTAAPYVAAPLISEATPTA